MSALCLAQRKNLKKQTVVSPAVMATIVPATDKGTLGGSVAKSSSSLLLAPRATTEKSMLQHDLWPLVSEFASLTGQFNDEMNQVTSHFLVELDMARERQAVAEASDGRSRTATTEVECAVVAVCKELEDALARLEGLTARLQAPEAEGAKAEEAAKPRRCTWANSKKRFVIEG